MRKALGLLLFAAAQIGAFALVVGFSLLPSSISDWGRERIGFETVIVCLGLAAVGSLLVALGRRGKRCFAPLAERVLAKDSRRPFLLLRAFEDDEGFIEAESSFEENLVAELKEYGPVIAIGRPGEWVPPLGAARKYVVEDWQGEILNLIRESRLIVVILGTTAGLAWELHQLIQLKALDKVILVFPPLDISELQRRWARFTTIAQNEGLPVQTIIPDGVAYVTFSGETECEIHSWCRVRRSWFFRSKPARNYELPLQSILHQSMGKPKSDRRTRSKITSIGVVNLIVGGLTLSAGSCIFPMAFTDVQEANRPTAVSHTGRDNWLLFCHLTGCFLWGVIAMPAAIGVLMRREWGRVLCMVDAGSALAMAIFTLLSLLFVSKDYFAGTCIIASGVSVLWVIYGLSVLIILTRPCTRREFSRQK